MDVKAIKEQLPYGALKEIAKRTNYSKSSISLFFNGKVSLSKSSEIYEVAAEILEENKTEKKRAVSRLSKALKL